MTSKSVTFRVGSSEPISTVFWLSEGFKGHIGGYSRVPYGLMSTTHV